MIVNFAERAHNHNWNLDPVTRSLLDTDFYKLLMLQFIWKHFPHTSASFELINRSHTVRLADLIPREDVIAQLDHARTVRFRKSEIIWLAGNTFYGHKGIFAPEFLLWLEHDFRLSDYSLSVEDGQFRLQFDGPWTATTMWELYALAILDELKTRAGLRGMTEIGLDLFYARAKTKLWSKMEQLRDIPGLKIADFGTRRRHSFLWQEYAINLARTVLGSAFAGTSNTYLAYKHDMEAIGTNAHELPMALAAMAPNDEALKTSQYRVLDLWQQTYQGELLIMLPDTFGTTQFLRSAPEWVADWTGQRVDSKDPFVAGEEYIAWLLERGRDPKTRLLIASDALDADTILRLHAAFSGRLVGTTQLNDMLTGRDFHDQSKWMAERRIRFSSGWGTLLTNDFRGCSPDGDDRFDPISLICKLVSADGRPAVKLSDNYAKATGLPAEVERYRRLFGNDGIASAPVTI